MPERRQSDRISVNMTVTRHIEGQAYPCRACEISPGGIRLEQRGEAEPDAEFVDIEVPLVEGGLTTSLKSRRVWQEDGLCAFKFEHISASQETILKKVFCR